MSSGVDSLALCNEIILYMPTVQTDKSAVQGRKCGGGVLGEGGQWSWVKVEAGVRDGGVYECPRRAVWLNLL